MKRIVHGNCDEINLQRQLDAWCLSRLIWPHLQAHFLYRCIAYYDIYNEFLENLKNQWEPRPKGLHLIQYFKDQQKYTYDDFHGETIYEQQQWLVDNKKTLIPDTMLDSSIIKLVKK